MAQVIAGADPQLQNQSKEEKKITIQIGVFFDGTNNNMLNIDEYNRASIKEQSINKKFKNNTSYQQGYSNVTHLYKGYYKGVDPSNNNLYYGKVYIEGAGTAPQNVNTGLGQEDSDVVGKGLAWGDYGINAKVERACELVAREVASFFREEKKKNPDAIIKVEKMNMDIFGFSRGAAAARSFASRIERKKGDAGRYKLITKNLPGKLYETYLTLEKYGKDYNVSLLEQIQEVQVFLNSIDINTCFMGLFDTVSSQGLMNSNDVKDLALWVYTPKRIVQLVAGDEYRDNFALTRIQSAGSKGIELVLPGAHSDIGGGYAEGEKEPLVVREPQPIYTKEGFVMGQTLPVYSGHKLLEELLREGWFLSEQEATRTIGTQYQLIPLFKMKQLATKFRGDMIKQEYFKNNKKLQLPNELTAFNTYVQGMSSNSLYNIENLEPSYKEGDALHTMIKALRHTYLHLSAKGQNDIVHYASTGNRRIIYPDV